MRLAILKVPDVSKGRVIIKHLEPPRQKVQVISINTNAKKKRKEKVDYETHLLICKTETKIGITTTAYTEKGLTTSVLNKISLHTQVKEWHLTSAFHSKIPFEENTHKISG